MKRILTLAVAAVTLACRRTARRGLGRSRAASATPPTPGARSSRWSTRAPGCRRTTSTPTACARPTRRRPTSAPTCGARSPRATSGIISRREATARMRKTLATLAGLERDPGQRPVLQLVRPGDRREADHLAGERRPHLPVPLQRRQRLAGGGAAHGRQRRAAAARAGARDRGLDGLRLLLRPGPGPALGRRVDGGAAGYTSRRPATGSPRTTTARSTPSRGSPPTSASRRAGSRPSTTSACSAPCPTTATTAGRSRSPRA